MKKTQIFALALICLLLCSCTTVIPTSVQAKEHLEKLGYTAELDLVKGKNAEEMNVKQITVLNAYRDNALVLQVYYFTDPDDTDRFFTDHEKNLRRDQEVFEKFNYTILRGTLAARDDFLSAGEVE